MGNPVQKLFRLRQDSAIIVINKPPGMPVQVAFNPITVNAIGNMLSRICCEEKLKITSEQIDSIAKASEGDTRNAITSLQYFYLK
ncbi:hypothetical protein L2E82_06992 [Cichorium intybus]|uniref:Uncharacterized protein n=1 Tax=Cichorium intybus TaxID=13427 RepID=A0ACB9G350_CICIN|nr:hypothetical protein L2E82_06992 [Cichorium intybus]